MTAAALAAAPVSLADSVTSVDWAGYAAHAGHVHFRQAGAIWRQPSITCSRPSRTFATMATGLGGLSANSIALEQIGTEGHCTAAGTADYSAFYSLSPGRRVAIPLVPRPGDVMQGIVQLGRGTVALALEDLSSYARYMVTLRDSHVDDSAAEWVLGAPTFCLTSTACQPLPLAEFAGAAFGLAWTRTSDGYLGAITDRRWGATRISIGLHGRRYSVRAAAAAPSRITVGGAVPSPLLAGGSAFTVAYRALSVGTSPFL